MAHDGITNEAFWAAVQDANLNIVRRYFEQPDGRVLVDEATVFVRDDDNAMEPPLWFVDENDAFVFDAIAHSGHVALIDWFFAEPTLVDALHALIQRIALAIVSHSTVAAHEMLEMVLASRVFTEAMTAEERHDTLATLFNTMAASGQNGWLELLLSHGADTSEPYNGTTPVLAATERGNAKTIDCLVLNGAIVTERGLVTYALYEENLDVARALVRLGADARSILREQNAALLEAAKGRDVDIVRLLLQDVVVDTDERDWRKCTPLMVVAEEDRGDNDHSLAIAIATLLLDHGADLDATDHYGCSVLHWGTRSNDVALLQLLLERGCDPNAQNDGGSTPLRELAECTMDDDVANMLDVLLQCGANPFIPCNGGDSALSILQRLPPGQAYVSKRSQFFRHS